MEGKSFLDQPALAPKYERQLPLIDLEGVTSVG